jgi:hypothetical protein
MQSRAIYLLHALSEKKTEGNHIIILLLPSVGICSDSKIKMDFRN